MFHNINFTVFWSNKSKPWWSEETLVSGSLYKIQYIISSYTTGRWMLESDWLVLRCVNIFRETHGERSSRHRITWPYHFSRWFLLLQRSYNRKITKLHYDTGQTNKYSKLKDKIDRSSPCFCPKMMLYSVRKALTLLSLSRSRSLSHRHTYSLHTP